MKIIQIAVAYDSNTADDALYALDDDGTIYYWRSGHDEANPGEWKAMPAPSAAPRRAASGAG